MATAVHLPRPNCVTSDVTDDDTEISDLHLLKEVSQRLNLATRRPSTVQWKQIIEFRKSIGLYNSDVEPEYLDKIVEAKMKTTSQKTYTKRRKFAKNGKEVKGSDDETIQAEKEDKMNNNLERKLPKLLKLKYGKAKLLPKNKAERTEPKTPQNNVKKFVKSSSNPSSPKTVAKSLKKHAFKGSKDSKTIQNSNENKPGSPLDDGRKNHSDVIKELVSKKTANGICRFPLYDTDDDAEDETGMSETAIRYRNIDKALGKIRRDLITMRMEDNSLARKLLDTRSEINLIRVRQSCDAHAEMLDDVTYEMEEEDLLPGLIKACDLPSRQPGSLLSSFSPLRTIGISRMNINRRRFSIR